MGGTSTTLATFNKNREIKIEFFSYKYIIWYNHTYQAPINHIEVSGVKTQLSYKSSDQSSVIIISIFL